MGTDSMNKKNCFTIEWYNSFMDMNILIVDDDKAVTDSIEFIILEWAERNHCKINYQIKKSHFQTQLYTAENAALFIETIIKHK